MIPVGEHEEDAILLQYLGEDLTRVLLAPPPVPRELRPTTPPPRGKR